MSVLRRPVDSLLLAAATVAALGTITAQESASGPGMPRGPQRPLPPFDVEAFAQRVREGLGVDEERVAKLRTAIAEEGGAAILVEELLREVSKPLDEAITAAEDGEPRAAILLARVATDENADRHLRAYAMYHIGRLFLDADEPKQAGEVFRDLLRTYRGLTPIDADAYFFFARSLADIPDIQAAASQFEAFLQLFPGASERLRAVAAQQAAELRKEIDIRAKDELQVHSLADEMRRIGRDIRKTETGKQVQTDQLEIVEQLEQIVKQLQQQESQSSGSASGNQQSQAPAADSSLPEGESRIGRLESVSGTAKRWGGMSDRERREIEAQVEEKMPAHYKRWLEEYYRKLNRNGRR